MIRSIAAFVFLASAAFAQGVAFDVASVKGGREPMPNTDRGEQVVAQPGSLAMRSVRLTTAVSWAYGAGEYQVEGPDWLNAERYDIMAKTDAATPVEQMRKMLQSLLADRFHMSIHRQTKEMEGLVITVGKGGHKLKESKSEGSIRMSKMGAVSEGGTVSELVGIAIRELRMPVIDQTGISGHFDFTLDTAPYITPETNKNSDMIAVLASAFKDELGLRLETRKIPVEMVIVEKADRRPSENQ